LIGNWANKFNLKNIEEYFDDNSTNVPVDVQAFSKFTDTALSEIEKVKLSPTNHNFLTQSLRLRSKASMRAKQSATPVLMSPGTNTSTIRQRAEDFFSHIKATNSPSNNFYNIGDTTTGFDQSNDYREKTAAGTARPKELSMIT
jgi:hypothetical protein